MPNDWDRDQEYPDISDEVRDVSEVCECDEIKAFPFHVTIPVSFYGPANYGKRYGYADTPSDDEGCGPQYNLSEDRNYKDAVIEG
jgi:hypothetical protein